MAVNGVKEEGDLHKGVTGQGYEILAVSGIRANAPANREQSDLTQEWLHNFCLQKDRVTFNCDEEGWECTGWE